MHRIHFQTPDMAIEYAMRHGGWIAMTEQGDVIWFDASAWTLSKIMSEIHCAAHIGPYSSFLTPEENRHRRLDILQQLVA